MVNKGMTRGDASASESNGVAGFAGLTSSALTIGNARKIQSSAAFATAGLTSDELIDLKYSVGGLYSTGPQVGFTFHRAFLAKIEKLKDSQGQYLYHLARDGMSATVAGYPLWENPGFETPAVSKYVGAFGNFAYQWLFDAGAMVVLVDTDAETFQRAVFGYVRAGALPVDANAFTLFQAKAS